MIILFTAPGCSKCTWLKDHVDLTGIEVHELTPDNFDALGALAWGESVNLAEHELPILLTENHNKITCAINIKNYLLKL